MNLKTNLFFIFLWVIILQSIAQENKNSKLLTKQKDFTVGEIVKLKFEANSNTKLQLYCTNSYGSTIIEGKNQKSIFTFTIPEFLSVKKGVLHWVLVGDSKKLNGNISIHPKDKPATLETYLGPPSIEAGGTDYSMLVVLPTDDLDNVLKDTTKVTIHRQFLSNFNQSTINTKNLIGYKNIYSPLKNGRMLLSTTSKELNSKEYVVNSMPAIAENFEISFKRVHEFADGNQITTFYTSIIKDKNNNIISDGSLVTFYIENKKGILLKTSGTTINGIAYAKILHPEFEDYWTVKAQITGIAESEPITLKFKKAVNDYTVVFKNQNRTILVGPIQSFMEQMIPDGLTVELKVFYQNKKIETVVKPSRNGFVEFNLDKVVFKNGNYTLKISTAGIEKVFESKKIW